MLSYYETAIAKGEIENDPEQRKILAPLEAIRQALNKKSRLRLPWNRLAKNGLYMHGDVGVGKTFLLDLFYENVNIKEKKRFHFHHFMQYIDAQLRQKQGQDNPLTKIVVEFAKTTRLLCLDEFLVHDVAHAMILAELLHALLEKGVVLVMTSNTAPENLYLHGVQRQRFLPAIASIKKHCQIFNLASTKGDYRLGREVALETYLAPLGEKTDHILLKQFQALEPQNTINGKLTIQNRDIAYIMRGEKGIWFDFQVICNLPRSQLDYLEIAEKFNTIFVSNIPKLTENDTVYAILLIHFIDVMYDMRIRVIISSQVSLENLYEQGEMKTSFQRTYSRLQEMQSEDYLLRTKR